MKLEKKVKISKVVLDTNIIISSLWKGKAMEVVDLWRDRKVNLIVSEEIINEYLNVLARFISDDELKEWAEIFADSQGIITVKPTKYHQVIKEDPDDDKFLDCAVAAKADFIVSGDKHLLNGLENLEDYKISRLKKLKANN